MVLFLLNIISHNALNLYGAVLSIITSIQTFASQWTPSIKVRVVLSSVVLAGCCLVALSASADFISEFIGLILALLLVLVQFDVFQSKLPTFHEFFAAKNWIYIGTAMGICKILHEFGHGLSCK